MTCVDQETGLISKEPLLTLASYRHIDGGLMFGVLANLAPCSFANNSRVKFAVNDIISVVRQCTVAHAPDVCARK